jgi:uncharacterized protein YhfF
MGMEDMGRSFIISVPDEEYEHAEAILSSVVENGNDIPTIVLLDWDHEIIYYNGAMPKEAIEPAASTGSFYFYSSASTDEETYQFFLSKKGKSRTRLGPSSYWHSLSFVLEDTENSSFRDAYCEVMLQGYDPPKEIFRTISFGDTPRMAKKLGMLIRSGRKTATTSLKWSYQLQEEPYPKIGDVYVVLNGRGIPLAVIQNTDVNIVPFNEVPREHAEAEGEGDGNLGWWQKIHWKFFSRECKQLGCTPDPRMPVVCETFTLLSIL